MILLNWTAEALLAAGGKSSKNHARRDILNPVAETTVRESRRNLLTYFPAGAREVRKFQAHELEITE